ncbi:hypothetical protein [Streptomyces sp. ODS05-4]|uniref:hypothetical protein n=1 Tax=Streptomyces sp. ODS05-4 TaxID=2944939 RepID=UPI00210ED743|nr:hypothetical protein [Streptomyces sp. ODS05-4]
MPNAKDLLTTAGFRGVVATVIDNNPGMDEATAGRITAEALKFVAAGAAFPTTRIAPSNVVDEGWHALILHTRLYRRLCDGLGHFVHHVPERPDPGRDDPHGRAHRAGRVHGRRRAVDGAEARTGAGRHAGHAHPPARRLRADQPRQLRHSRRWQWWRGRIGRFGRPQRVGSAHRGEGAENGRG